MEIRDDIVKVLEAYWLSNNAIQIPSGWYYGRGDKGRREVIEYHFSGDVPAAIVLYWNGGRWVVWIRNKRFMKERGFDTDIGDELSLFVAEPTEFKNKNDPPMEWALQMYDLT